MRIRSLEKYTSSIFYDYAPKIFTIFRNLNGISRDEYLKSLGIDSLRRFISGNGFKGMQTQGKSGSFFFTTSDQKFFVKTIPDREFDVAIAILPVLLGYLKDMISESGKSMTLLSQYIMVDYL